MVRGSAGPAVVPSSRMHAAKAFSSGLHSLCVKRALRMADKTETIGWSRGPNVLRYLGVREAFKA